MLSAVLDGYDNANGVIVQGGYIRVVQDVRGKYGSGGIYMMTPPLAGTPLNPTRTDDSTDSYHTIRSARSRRSECCNLPR